MIKSKYVHISVNDIANILDEKPVFVYIEPEGIISDQIQIESKFLTVNYKVDQNKYEVVWNMK